MEKKVGLFAIITIFLLIPFGLSQAYSMDISGLKSEDYSIGEEINFKVILLDGQSPTTKEITLEISDALEKKKVTKTINSNEDSILKIGEDFPSGLWTMTATFGETKVERNFRVGENKGVEFSIEGDELIIKNKGNVRYTETIQIKIGDETRSYAQNIRVGDEKRLKLISPEGAYNIEVTDGKTSIKRENVQLFGTGNVIGAVDKELVGYTGLAGAGDIASRDDRFFSLSKLPVALVFIAAIGILTALIVVERKITKKKK